MRTQGDLGFDLDCVLAAFALAVTLERWDSAEAWADRAFRLGAEERATAGGEVRSGVRRDGSDHAA